MEITRPSVSIIVPVYNSETYLNECLDSIIHQTITNIEIICINDGSTDNSLRILQEYASKDDRVIIIDKDNGGQGLARNQAIEIATGEYIGFVDSDDWIDENMFLELYESAKKFSSDVSICEFELFDSKTDKITQPQWTKIPYDTRFDNRSFHWSEATEILFKIQSGPCNKIYESDFLKQINAKFSEGLIYEDIFFVYKCLIYSKIVNYIRKPLYTIRYSRAGSTSSDISKKQFDIFIVLEQLQKSIEQSGNFELLKKVFYKYKFNQYFFHFIEVSKEFKKEFWEKIKTELKTIEKETYNTIFNQSLRSKIALKTINNYFLFRLCLMSINRLFQLNLILRN